MGIINLYVLMDQNLITLSVDFLIKLHIGNNSLRGNIYSNSIVARLCSYFLPQ